MIIVKRLVLYSGISFYFLAQQQHIFLTEPVENAYKSVNFDNKNNMNGNNNSNVVITIDQDRMHAT